MRNLTIPLLLIILMACNSPKETKSLDQSVTRVKIAKVTVSEGQQNLTFSGTIIPFQSIPVSFQTTGTVQSVLVEEGMPVRKGQLLATLDKKDLTNMFNLSNAQYIQALDAYNRLKEVHDKGSLTDIKWAEMESNLKQAEASMNLAKSSLEKGSLFSPESGFISKRNIEPGMSALSITAPFEIVKIDQIYVRLSVPESEIAKMIIGMSAKFTVPAIGDTKFNGKIAIVGVVADQFARTYEVRVLADNPDNKIKPGMICDIVLEVNHGTEKVVDYRAISHDSEGSFVYKVSANHTSVTRQSVKVGQMVNNGIEILSGLQTNDEVVCEGLEKITNNSKISL